MLCKEVQKTSVNKYRGPNLSVYFLEQKKKNPWLTKVLCVGSFDDQLPPGEKLLIYEDRTNKNQMMFSLTQGRYKCILNLCSICCNLISGPLEAFECFHYGLLFNNCTIFFHRICLMEISKDFTRIHNIMKPYTY